MTKINNPLITREPTRKEKVHTALSLGAIYLYATVIGYIEQKGYLSNKLYLPLAIPLINCGIAATCLSYSAKKDNIHEITDVLKTCGKAGFKWGILAPGSAYFVGRAVAFIDQLL